jgi:hypothetical protein
MASMVAVDAAISARPLETSARIEAGDAITWSTLGIANALTGKLDDALRCFERALSLESDDEHQDAAFYEDVRRKISVIRQARRPPPASATPARKAASFPDFESAREHLARLGIDLRERRVIVPCQKADRQPGAPGSPRLFQAG